MSKSKEKVSRNRKIVQLYQKGDSIRKVADKLGMTFQRVHQLIKREAPKIMRPVGKAG